MKRALNYVRPYWRRLLLVIGLSLLGTALSLCLPYLSKGLIDHALLGRDWTALLRTVSLFAAITAGSFLLNTISGLRYTRVSAEILFDMRLALYRHLQRLSPRFYARTRLGDIVSRINNDIGEIQRVAAESVLAWFGNILYLVGTVGMLLWLDARLFLASVALLPLSIWVLSKYRRALESKIAVMRQASADIGSFLIETLQGMKLVVTSNAQEREVERFRAKNDSFIRALMRVQRLTYFSGGLPGLLLSLGTLVVFIYGGWQVIHGLLTMGSFVAFLAYQMRILPPIQALMGLYANLATVRVSMARVNQILDTAPEVGEGGRESGVGSRECQGRIAFDDVSFKFDRDTPVLEHLSFMVEPGQTVAIVGPSGSGKSTIADLLLRLLDPDHGTIRLDGLDLRTLDLADLRRHVVLVDQEPFVFHTSVAENLRYVRPSASDDELRDACRAAGIDAFIASLPLGYDTVVGERGTALSSGERQRLAIARAFLANPTVLILDEPTAALDPASEQQVVAGYEALMRGRTTIVISHRFELACQADRVIVLRDARIVEEGSPSDLQHGSGPFAQHFLRSSVVVGT
jgi:ATP-binding cassette subfamily B protein